MSQDGKLYVGEFGTNRSGFFSQSKSRPQEFIFGDKKCYLKKGRVISKSNNDKSAVEVTDVNMPPPRDNSTADLVTEINNAINPSDDKLKRERNHAAIVEQRRVFSESKGGVSGVGDLDLMQSFLLLGHQ